MEDKNRLTPYKTMLNNMSSDLLIIYLHNSGDDFVNACATFKSNNQLSDKLFYSIVEKTIYRALINHKPINTRDF
jgi:hypothetical protein